VRNEHLRAGRLGDVLDVLVLPDTAQRLLDQGRAGGSAPERYTGGLDPEGAVAVEEFVRRGGTLVAIEDAAAWAIELFDLPLVDVAHGSESGEFSCPGSVLRAVPRSAPVTLGLPESVALFFSGSSAWRVEERERGEGDDGDGSAPEVLLEYAPARTLLSGWIRDGERIAGRAAWVRADHGAGRVHLFAFSPHYRSWTQQTFGLLFRAIFDGRDGALR
jgi:hypothetical protein